MVLAPNMTATAAREPKRLARGNVHVIYSEVTTGTGSESIELRSGLVHPANIPHQHMDVNANEPMRGGIRRRRPHGDERDEGG